jgi:hypothetical protein
LAGNLEKPLVSLFETEWRERDFGLWEFGLRKESLFIFTERRLSETSMINFDAAFHELHFVSCSCVKTKDPNDF